MSMEFVPLNENSLDKKLRAYEQQQKQNEIQLAKITERKYYENELASLEKSLRMAGASEQSIQIALKGHYEVLKITYHAAQRRADPAKSWEPKGAPDLTGEAQALLLSELETQEIHWLWEKRIPLGKITVLDGDPGMGKSLLAINLAARVSTGQVMPDASPGQQGPVVFIAPEDGAADTLKPRLEAAGGDPSQVTLLNTIAGLDVKKIKVRRPFSLALDLDKLEGLILQKKPILVILDPLTAVLGRRLDASRDQDIREVFTPLAQLAEDTGCAILIIRHLNKRSSENPLYRGAGSIGIIAAARMGLIVAQDPLHEHRRILATIKNDLCKQTSNLTYQIVENAGGIPSIQWLGENLQAVESFLPGPKLSPKRQEILRVLKASPAPLSFKEMLERTDYSYGTLQRTLSRMHAVGEIASPARGLYTALGHPNSTGQVTPTADVPTEQPEHVSELSELSETSHSS